MGKGELTELDKTKKSHHAHAFIQIRELFKRAFKNSYRNPLLLMIKIVQAVIIGIIIDAIFHDLGYSRYQAEARKGLLFYMTMNLIMVAMQSSSISFIGEKPVFIKEYKQGLYNPPFYMLAKIISEIPSQIVFTIIYSVIIYFACNLNTKDYSKYFIFFITALLCHLCGNSYGILGSSFSTDVVSAKLYSALITAPLIMFGGFFSNTNSLSGAFYWVKYISAFFYGYGSFTTNEFNDLPLDDGIDPLDELDITWEIWQYLGGLLLIYFCCTIFSMGFLWLASLRFKTN